MQGGRIYQDKLSENTEISTNKNAPSSEIPYGNKEIVDQLLKSNPTEQGSKQKSEKMGLKEFLSSISLPESVDNVIKELETLGVKEMEHLEDLEKNDLELLKLTLITKKRLWNAIMNLPKTNHPSLKSSTIQSENLSTLQGVQVNKKKI